MHFDAEWLDALREDMHLEAKSAAGGFPKSFWESYSALANTDGGTILIGASEDAGGRLRPTGVYDAEDAVQQLWNTLNNPNKVSVNLLTSKNVTIHTVEGAQVIQVDVPRASRSQRPVFINGNPLIGAFRRNGEGDYRCSREECDAMIRYSSPQGADGAVVEGCSVSALCAPSIAAYRNHLRSARPDHPWVELEDAELLLRLGAAGRLAEDFEIHPTRAGLLCFGYEYEIVREFPQYFLDYRDESEAGVERWGDRVVSNDGTWSGNLFDFWRMVSPRLSASIKRPFALDGNMQRVDDTAMHKAVREGLVNALIHADYFGRRGTVVVKRTDRVEFSNPGSLLIAREVALGGGISEARNPVLMKIFGLVNACEKAGGGFDAMQFACRAVGAKPLVLEEGYQPERTALTLFLGAASAIDSDTAASIHGSGAVPQSVPDFLTSDEKLVLEYLGASDAAQPRAAVQDALGFGSTKTKKLLGALARKGRVMVEGSGNRVAYRRCQ